MSDQSVPWNLEALRESEAWLRPLVRSLVGPADTDDVLQETWLKAWQQPPGAVRTVRQWLRTVATNFARSHRRRERRRERHESGAATDAIESTAATVERLSLHRAVSQAVIELPEPYRTVVLLHHYHELDAATIAARTGTSAANARQRLHRGHEWLRQRLSGELGDDWRKRPAVLALLLPSLPAAPIASLSLVLAMNKMRLTVAALVVGCMFGAALLVPDLLSPAPVDPPDDTTAVLAAGKGTEGPAPESPGARNERQAVESGARAPVAASGLVVDTQGRPTAGVRIGFAAKGGQGEVELATADAGGRFTLASWPERRIEALPPWIALAVQPPGAEGASIVVAPCRRQTLRVVDAAGTALPGVQAMVESHALVGFPHVLERAVQTRIAWGTTDGEGRCTWAQLPELATFFSFRHQGFAPQRLEVGPAMPLDLLVTLQPLVEGTRIVTGVVTDNRFAFAAGARVGLGPHVVTADAHGRYQIAIGPGQFVDDAATLHASMPGWYPTVVADFGKRVNGEPLRMHEQDLQLLQAALTIRGRVLDHRGEPCASVLVYPWELALLTDRESAEDLAAPAGDPLSLAGNPVRAFTRTDAQGGFVVPGLGAREYRLRFYDDAAKWAFSSGPLAAGASGVVIRVPAPATGSVAGRLVTRDGKPAARVTLHAHVTIHANGGGVVGRDVGLETESDAEGRFRIEQMPRLGVDLSSSGEDWMEHSWKLDEASDLQALELTVMRRCHARVECTGAAWADARIQFVDERGATMGITERRRSTVMTRHFIELHEGKTQVFALSEAATTLVVRTKDGKREKRVPVVLRPGEVTTLVPQLD